MNNKLENIVIKYLNKLYGDLKEYRTDEYPNKVFYMKNNKIYMEKSSKTDKVWIDYYTIWLDLKNTFSLEYVVIKSIIIKWIGSAYNLRVETLYPSSDVIELKWELLII